MSGLARIGGVGVLCSGLMLATAFGQNLVLGDTLVLLPLKCIDRPGTSFIRFRFTQHMEYAITSTSLMFLNWQQDPGAGLVSWFQHLNYRSKFSNERNLLLTGSLSHDFGMQFFFDSITRFHPDANILDIKAEVKQGRHLAFFLFARLSTRFFNAYNYQTDPAGASRKVLNATFLTPLVCTFSAGMGWNNPQLATVNLGFSGVKLTYIRNREIYSQLNVPVFYGVPRDKSFRFEYGLSLQVVVDQQVLKRIQWNCDLLLFKNFEQQVDLVLKNQFGIKFGRFIKGAIQTRLIYDEESDRHLQVENLVSVGFSINL